MKTLYTIVFALLALVTNAQNTWTQKEDFTAGPRLGGAVFVIDGLAYHFGGGNLGTFYDDLWAYDPVANTWTEKANCPGGPKNHPGAFVVNGKAYICGGGNATNTATAEVWEYNPMTNTWTQKNNFPGGARMNVFAFAVGDKGFLGGGNSGTFYYDDFWEYDAASDAWTQKADYPPGDAYYFGGTFVINNIGYVAGHKPPGGSNNAPVADLWSYNPATNQWTQKANMISPAMFAATFAINGKGYVVAGRTNIGAAGAPLTTTMEYDPVSDSWSLRAAFPGAARWGNRGFAVNNKGYSLMGSDASSYYDDLYEYTGEGCPVFTPWISSSLMTFETVPGYAAYQWYQNGAAINGATDSAYTVTQSGDYYVVVTDANGCTSQSDVFNLTINGIGATSGLSPISVYPNPATNFVNVTSSNAIGAIQIVNALGQVILTQRIDSKNGLVDVNELTNGVYQMRFINRSTSGKTFVKQ